MKTTKMLAIVVLALSLMVCPVKMAGAAPMGTAWTYQGRLIDANSAADGLYDFQFGLYDDPNVNWPVADVNVPDVDVIDGYFTVELDFGSEVFDGNSVWLGIGVRPGDLNDPNVYTMLSPRQEVMPVPYALQTRGIFVDSAGDVGIGTTNPTQKLEVAGSILMTGGTLKIDPTTPTLDPIIELKSDDPFSKRSFISFWHQGSNLWMVGSDLLNEETTNFSIRDVQAGNSRFYIDPAGNVGIGTTNPTQKLEVAGSILMTGGTLKIDPTTPTLDPIIELKSDDPFSKRSFVSFWHQGSNLWRIGSDLSNEDTTNFSISDVQSGNSRFYIDSAGNIGIGDTTPDAKLDVEGDLIITGKATIGPSHTNTGSYAFVAGNSNTVTDDYGTVAGGGSNQAGDGAGTTSDKTYAAISGGYSNTASESYSTVGGGYGNTASGGTSFVGGGETNTASGALSMIGGGASNNATFWCVTVGGGSNNTASQDYATVGGGEYNTASGQKATVPGGGGNTASGHYSFAAGRRAKANNNGCFVWGDYTNADVTCGTANRWLARASGGVYFYTDSGLTSGVYVSAGGNSWNSISDRATKENFTRVDNRAILEQLATLPIQGYNLKSQDPSIRHIGPVAQDFARFGYGESETAINMEDADGVALAAIQGLYQLVQEKDAKIAELKKQNEKMEARLASMENVVAKLNPWQEGGQE